MSTWPPKFPHLKLTNQQIQALQTQPWIWGVMLPEVKKKNPSHIRRRILYLYLENISRKICVQMQSGYKHVAVSHKYDVSKTKLTLAVRDKKDYITFMSMPSCHRLY